MKPSPLEPPKEPVDLGAPPPPAAAVFPLLPARDDKVGRASRAGVEAVVVIFS